MKKLLFLLPILLSAQTRNVILTWQANVNNPPSGVGYNIYRAPSLCSPVPSNFIKINTNQIVALTFTDTTSTIGFNYCYGVKTTVNNLESVFSNLVDTSIAPLPPSNLTIAPAVATLRPGAKQQFTSTTLVTNWSIYPILGAISSDGLYQAPNSIQGNNKKVTIQATNNLESDTAQVTIKK